MLTNNGESLQPCLVPDLRRNGFSFSPLRTMLAVGLSVIKNLPTDKSPGLMASQANSIKHLEKS